MRPRKVWFGDVVRFALFTRYRQIRGVARVPLMVRRSFTTVLLDLNCSPEALLASCAANCRNEIRRGDKEELTFRAGPPIARDVEFFAAFMALRGIGRVNMAYLSDPSALVTSVYSGDERLASHLYLMPPGTGRARLIYSATSAPADASDAGTRKPSSKVGAISNRWLHYQDALFLQEHGARLCDLGGLGGEGADSKIEGINRFKRSFGGIEVTESNYDPLLLAVVDAALKRLGRLAMRLRR